MSSLRPPAPTAGRRSRGAIVCLAGFLAALAASPTRSFGLDPRDVRPELERALADPALRQAEVGALVVRADDGAPLFARDPDRRLVPASNAKILTSLGALATLGPAHRFMTRVYADRAPDGAGAVGTLAVRGGGDPALTSEEWWRLAADLRRAGLRRVAGDVLLDDSLFDAERWHPNWQATSAAYHAPVGALTANYGTFTVEVAPGPAAAAPATVRVDPPIAYLKLANSARTVAGGAPAVVVEVGRLADGEEVRVSGRIPAGAEPEIVHRSLADPLVYAGAVLRMQLEALGIEVGGRMRAGAVPPGAVEVLAFAGKPLSEVVRLLMKYSNNNMAECLFKGLGAGRTGKGTWASGAEALRAELAGLGLDGGGFALVDGSGLSTQNRVSPRSLVDAIRVARGSFRFGPEFLSALPIAGRDGTLENRAARARDAVRAKTGLLAGAAGLSGLARRRDGVDLVFSVLVNGYRGGGADVMAALDRFAAALLEAGSESLP